tara:strand:+ start:4104 stop:7376 length:3273 start_codon:yes stop_codon:yes gene_type:complete
MNSQEIIATFETSTKKKATFKNGKFKEIFLDYNHKLLKQGKTKIYLNPLKFYNPMSTYLNKHKLTKAGVPTKASLKKQARLVAEADIDYVTKNGDLVKLPESVKNNPVPYLEQEFDVKVSSLTDLKNNSFTLLKNIPSSKNINLLLKITFDLFYDNEFDKTLRFNKTVNTNAEELSDKNYIMGLIEEWWGGDLEDGTLRASNIIVDHFSKKTGQKLTLEDMKLFLGNPLNIDNLYNEIITKDYKDCVYDYLMDLWGKKLSKKQKILLEDKRTINELYEFCKIYHIKLLAYDITGNIIKSYYPTKKQKKFNNLVFIAYNEHLYPVKNRVLNKVYIDTTDLIHKNITNTHDKLIEYFEKGYLPKILRLNSDAEVTAFIADKIIYFQNEDYDDCKKILENMGLADRMKWSVNYNNIANVIEEVYTNGNNISSFWTNSREFTKGGFTYKVNDYKQHNSLIGEEYVTADKNKAYSNALLNLPFLITVDFKTDRICKYENNIIEPQYLYIVQVNKSNILLPNTNIYSGFHIALCKKKGLKQGKDFIIKEYIETTRQPNYLKQMILDIYDKVEDKTIAKKIVNVYIGKMERAENVDEYVKPSKIMGEVEMQTYTGDYECLGFSCGEEFYVGLETQKVARICNRKPIAIMIKDYSRFTLFEFMEKNNIMNEDVIQVKTDSITFKKTNDNYKEYLSDTLDGWKLEDFKELISTKKYNKEQLTLNFRNKSIIKLNNTVPYKKNCIVMGYAGNGKSHFVKTELIPKIVEDNETYEVLTPSHDSANEYRRDQLSVRVIQGYTFNNKIPEQQHIIIDEIGMVSSNDWLVIIKCILLGKYVYCFGDFNQLSPVKSSKITRNFLESLFEYQVWFKENFRNNYSTDYYKELITSKDSKFLYNEVMNKSCENWSEGCILVAYRNTVRHKHNKEICDKLSVPYILKKDKNDKDILEISSKIPIDVPIICKSNILSSFGIYNKFTFKIKENKGDTIIITDGLSEYNLKYETIKRYFDYAYCRTLYSIQGKSIELIKFCKEDIKMLSNEEAYTFISRFKEKVDTTNKIKYKLINFETHKNIVNPFNYMVINYMEKHENKAGIEINEINCY